MFKSHIDSLVSELQRAAAAGHQDSGHMKSTLPLSAGGGGLSVASNLPKDPKIEKNQDLFLLQECSQYCWEFHDQLWEALCGTTSEKRGVARPT